MSKFKFKEKKFINPFNEEKYDERKVSPFTKSKKDEITQNLGALSDDELDKRIAARKKADDALKRFHDREGAQKKSPYEIVISDNPSLRSDETTDFLALPLMCPLNDTYGIDQGSYHQIRGLELKLAEQIKKIRKDYKYASDYDITNDMREIVKEFPGVINAKFLQSLGTQDSPKSSDVFNLAMLAEIEVKKRLTSSDENKKQAAKILIEDIQKFIKSPDPITSASCQDMIVKLKNAQESKLTEPSSILGKLKNLFSNKQPQIVRFKEALETLKSSKDVDKTNSISNSSLPGS